MAQEQIPNLDGLVELGNRDGVDIRPTLLRVTTDLYVAKDRHSAEEERHYTELALRLIDLVDAPTRAIVAKRLATYAAAPPAVVQRLAGVGLGTTAAALATARAQSMAGQYAAADELSDLFFAARADERRLILLNLDYAPLLPAAPLARQAAAEAVRRLEAAAFAHNIVGFAQELERALSISRAQARRLIEDPSGEAIVVAAIALGMPADVLQRILLCLNPAIGQSVQRVYELATLYEEIEPSSALRLLAIWRAAKNAQPPVPSQPAEHPVAPPLPPRPAAHQPFYWHVEPSKLRAPAPRPKIRWQEHEPAPERKQRG